MTRSEVVTSIYALFNAPHNADINIVGLNKVLDDLVSAEREAIAQMVEDAPSLMEFAQNHQGGCLMCGFMPKQAAEVIRARGQA